ncbi:MAG TPA: hypothetical protein VFZ01_17245 [Geminicoccaceae bacterium]
MIVFNRRYNFSKNCVEPAVVFPQGVHRGRHPGGRAVHRRGSDQDGGGGRDLRRHRRPAVRSLLPSRLRYLGNISLEGLDDTTDAAAHAVLTFAMTTSSVNGTDNGSDKAARDADQMEFLGSRFRK